MKCSEITLYEAIKKIDSFAPVKIVLNDIVIYNDYDSEVENEDGLYGEIFPPLAVLPDRIREFGDSVMVTSVNIEIVDFHHSIVTIRGRLKSN